MDENRGVYFNEMEKMGLHDVPKTTAVPKPGTNVGG